MRISTTDAFGAIVPKASLRGADARLRRVREHMLDLDRAVVIFQTKLDSIRIAATNYNGDASIYERPVKDMGDAREDVAVITGEAIQDLRSALDYLAFELAYLDSRVINKRTQFPIDKLPNEFAAHRRNYMKGIKDAHVAVIERFQEYARCHWAPLLRDLSNEDKHRRLHWIDGVVEIDFPGFIPSDEPSATFRQFLEAIELKANVNVDFDPPFFVAFEDGRPVKETLDVLQSQVSHTVDLFRPCFAGECSHFPPTEWLSRMEELPLLRPRKRATTP